MGRRAGKLELPPRPCLLIFFFSLSCVFVFFSFFLSKILLIPHPLDFFLLFLSICIPSLAS
jgi:hypothetical protein